ncbi:MAG: hypothetical protein J3K34DRAFT_523929 [Monoraphidium minutum]|nr:MAG: hypothetical protein J3K34DRAFT_523929 [Monoraphidium minutum]
MLSLRATTVSRAPCAARRTPATRLAPVRASSGGGLGEALNSVGDAFVRIFSPAKDDAPNSNWAGTMSSYSGRVSRGGGRPFKDGFAGGAAKAAPRAAAAVTDSIEEEGYMGGALKGLMGKNFAAREDEERPSTGSAGWQGAIHDRKRDGEVSLEAKIRQELIRSGERERLKRLLREKLTECGWRDDIKQRCREYIQQRGPRQRDGRRRGQGRAPAGPRRRPRQREGRPADADQELHGDAVTLSAGPVARGTVVENPGAIQW